MTMTKFIIALIVVLAAGFIGLVIKAIMDEK